MRWGEVVETNTVRARYATGRRMGRSVGGRWGWHRRKTRAESCRWFTVAEVVGAHPPAAGRSGTLLWRDAGGGESALAFTFATERSVVLAYGWGSGADRKEFAYPLDLVALPTPHGGTRYVARCPLTADGPRVPLPPGTSWEDVTVEVDDHHLLVRTAGGEWRIGYEEAGFADGRTGAPNSRWALLRLPGPHHPQEVTPHPTRRVPPMTATADLGDVCKLLAEVRDLLRSAPPADPLAVGAEDLADLLGTSERNVWKLSGGGLIPEPFKLGGRVLWNVAEVRRWLDAGSPDRETWARIKKAK